MKKLIALVLTLACVLALTGCGKNDTYKIKIVVPAGSTEEIVYQEDFVYSDEEISPIGNKITIYSGDGLGDTEVVLKPISVNRAFLSAKCERQFETFRNGHVYQQIVL